MSPIPAVQLQQLIGLDEYEQMLAIDRVARELGMTADQVKAEVDAVESTSSGPQLSVSPAADASESESRFTAAGAAAELDDVTPTFLDDAQKFRFSYDPSQDGEKRQKQVSQAIVCPHCSAPLGIPDVRPIRVSCPSCMMETTYEK